MILGVAQACGSLGCRACMVGRRRVLGHICVVRRWGGVDEWDHHLTRLWSR